MCIAISDITKHEAGITVWDTLLAIKIPMMKVPQFEIHHRLLKDLI